MEVGVSEEFQDIVMGDFETSEVKSNHEPSTNFDFPSFSLSSSSIAPFPSTTLNPPLSEKALGKRPEQSTRTIASTPRLRKIHLNPTKSAALALLSNNQDLVLPAPASSSSKVASLSIDQPLVSPSLLSPQPQPEASSSTSTSLLLPPPPPPSNPNSNSNSTQDPSSSSVPPIEDPTPTSLSFVAPNGRSLRARTIRPSYLEIPPSQVNSLFNPIASTSTSENSKSKFGYDETAVGLLETSGKLVKSFERWVKERGGGTANGATHDGQEDEGEGRKEKRRRRESESSLSSLESSDNDDDDNETITQQEQQQKSKTKRPRTTTIPIERTDRDSSPLSSIASSSRSSSILSSPSPEPEPLPLAFPHKSIDHPLNRHFKGKGKPRRPSTPPDLGVFEKVQGDLNRFSWEEGLREITYRGEIVEPTYEEEDALEEEGEAEGGNEKKKPGWEWEPTPSGTTTTDRSVSPLPIATTSNGTSLAHPPPPSTNSLKPTSSFLSVPVPLNPVSIPVPSLSLPRTASFFSNFSAPPPPPSAPIALIARPKTYRQIARLDWSDFHQRNKCRFTTSGATDGVNPEGLGWEDWYGIEDEFVALLKTTNGVDPTPTTTTNLSMTTGFGSKKSSTTTTTTTAELFVLSEKRRESLGGRGTEEDFESVQFEESFVGGMEWMNEWRFKTLEEGMGNTWEYRCRWAVRNPARKYEVEEEEEKEKEKKSNGKRMGKKELAELMMRERLEAERLQRKRERKKAKREKARREREGSGGESELTPFEGEELSPDSDETDEEQGEPMTAAMIAERSSLIMQEAANAHAASGKTGVMVRCPLPSCPQRFYRSKASSSAATHHRHYHTDSINLKYSTGISAYIVRSDEGNFVCPAPNCDFVTKSRGTMAVHGKPAKGNCLGPPESIPKPKKKGGKKNTTKQFFNPIPIAPTPTGSRAGSVVSSSTNTDQTLATPLEGSPDDAMMLGE
ncbi:uncharacterized protein JCM6883_004209 [Sporobolomyces salmoneus]|uniref:uncharacterized protein n=1 Tax=Sporobolomyces salmoneus TaxID=183962 RepID=UPI00317654F1